MFNPPIPKCLFNFCQQPNPLKVQTPFQKNHKSNKIKLITNQSSKKYSFIKLKPNSVSKTILYKPASFQPKNHSLQMYPLIPNSTQLNNKLITQISKRPENIYRQDQQVKKNVYIMKPIINRESIIYAAKNNNHPLKNQDISMTKQILSKIKWNHKTQQQIHQLTTNIDDQHKHRLSDYQTPIYFRYSKNNSLNNIKEFSLPKQLTHQSSINNINYNYNQNSRNKNIQKIQIDQHNLNNKLIKKAKSIISNSESQIDIFNQSQSLEKSQVLFRCKRQDLVREFFEQELLKEKLNAKLDQMNIKKVESRNEWTQKISNLDQIQNGCQDTKIIKYNQNQRIFIRQ